ncbi:MAG TPA: CPBP family intramembrane glutamic endopeptidase [Chitinophagaceae bacterium]|nr:CPBP family intramembrane glutamic endopeptidase [Chitinophagaceae bacterium]
MPLTNTLTKLIGKAVLFCTVFTLLFFLLSFLKPLFPQPWERLTHGVIGTVAALITTGLFLKYDKISFSQVGLAYRPTTLRNFLPGLLAGILIMGLLSALVITGSGFVVTANSKSSVASFLVLSLPLLLLAYMEELAFRGYPLVLLKDRAGTRNTLLITTLLFALYHVANGWSLQSALLGPGAWGILFGLAAMFSKGISMPTGLHYGVNLTTAAFGINDSSFNVWILRQGNGASLETYQSSAREVLLPQLGILLLALLLMEWYVRKKKVQPASTTRS